MNRESPEALSPFAPAPLYEEIERRALTQALLFSEGFSLLFACCNPIEQRRRMMDDLGDRLTDAHLVVFQAPVSHLLDELRRHFDTPPTHPVFVTGLEASFPETEEAWHSPLIRNLNAARDSLPVYLHAQLVLFVPQSVLAAIQHGAPDFFSIHSGVYHFSPTPSQARARVSFLTSGDHSALWGLTPQERTARVTSLAEMLTELHALQKNG